MSAANNDIAQLHTEQDLETRDRLIQAAKILFSEKGYDGTTVKNISDAAGMNVSLISYHFNGKEGLYRACLEQYGKAQLDASRRILRKAGSQEELKIRLQLFLEEFITIHLEEPHLVKIVTRECDLGIPIAQDIFQNTFLKIFETLGEFLGHAVEAKLIRAELDPQIIAGVLFGGLIHTLQKDQIAERFYGKTIRNSEYREKWVKTLIEVWFNGCAVE